MGHKVLLEGTSGARFTEKEVSISNSLRSFESLGRGVTIQNLKQLLAVNADHDVLPERHYLAHQLTSTKIQASYAMGQPDIALDFLWKYCLNIEQVLGLHNPYAGISWDEWIDAALERLTDDEDGIAAVQYDEDPIVYATVRGCETADE